MSQPADRHEPSINPHTGWCAQPCVLGVCSKSYGPDMCGTCCECQATCHESRRRKDQR